MLSVTPFKSLYAILYISPKNEWFDTMVVAAEPPNHDAAGNSRRAV